MTPTLMIVCVLIALAVLFVALVWREWQTPRPIAARVILPPVPSPPPPELVTIRMVDEQGRVLGETAWPRKNRRPTFTYRPDGSWYTDTFVMTGVTGTVFLYRRVGREPLVCDQPVVSTTTPQSILMPVQHGEQ